MLFVSFSVRGGAAIFSYFFIIPHFAKNVNLFTVKIYRIRRGAFALLRPVLTKKSILRRPRIGIMIPMNYVKKLCILKQVAPGFAADGKNLSALLTAEQYAGRLTLTLALIGFAPLSAGRYRCVVCDEHGGAETFDVNGSTGGTVRRASALDIADGIGCAVCFVHGQVRPAAFGKCGDKTYDLKKMCALLGAEEQPPAPPRGARRAESKPPADAADAKTAPAPAPAAETEAPPYDDELVASENYFAFEQKGDTEHADGQDRAGKAQTDGGKDAGTHEDAQSLFRFAGAENLGKDARPCYFDTVKADLDALFESRPAETALQAAIPTSRWVRVEFGKGKYYVVGVIEENARAKYICYGVPTQRRGTPPEAIKKYSSFVPASLFRPTAQATG